jgi:glycosyltransferase involved in cell wall biosynthesis
MNTHTCIHVTYFNRNPQNTKIRRVSIQDLSFPIVGMSDQMPYPSSQFKNLSLHQRQQYMKVFRNAIQKAIDEYEPDLIHCHHLWVVSSVVVDVVRRMSDIPIVVSCHGSDLRQFKNDECAWFRDAIVENLRNVSAVTVLSKDQKQEVVELYHIEMDKIYVVYAGFRDDLFKIDRARRSPFMKGKEESPMLDLIFAGKLSRAKGLACLIKALDGDHEGEGTLCNYRLNIYGSGHGPEKEEVEKLAAQLTKGVAEFHGAVDQATLAKAMSNAHVFVLPSMFEGLPLVLLEAMSCGCVVVVTDLPGVREIIEEGGDGCKERVFLVPLPQMERNDIPMESEIRPFIARLHSALDDASRFVKKSCLSDSYPKNMMTEEVMDFLKKFTWKMVFERVRRVYDTCLRM